jgi:hypothetical protein
MTSSNKLININENVVNLSTVKYDLDAPLLHRLDEQQVVPVAPVANPLRIIFYINILWNEIYKK